MSEDDARLPVVGLRVTFLIDLLLQIASRGVDEENARLALGRRRAVRDLVSQLASRLPLRGPPPSSFDLLELAPNIDSDLSRPPSPVRSSTT